MLPRPRARRSAGPNARARYGYGTMRWRVEHGAIERVLMTHLETEALNHPFREAEAVLIADPTNPAF